MEEHSVLWLFGASFAGQWPKRSLKLGDMTENLTIPESFHSKPPDTTSSEMLVQALRTFQQDRRLAVSEMARLFEIGQPTMWRILHGRHSPRGTTLGAMARAGVKITLPILRSL
jgi:predicted DNA-binding transcriptional regulator AlpA